MPCAGGAAARGRGAAQRGESSGSSAARRARRARRALPPAALNHPSNTRRPICLPILQILTCLRRASHFSLGSRGPAFSVSSGIFFTCSFVLLSHSAIAAAAAKLC